MLRWLIGKQRGRSEGRWRSSNGSNTLPRHWQEGNVQATMHQAGHPPYCCPICNPPYAARSTPGDATTRSESSPANQD